ncbi:MAG: IS1634 family transposase [Clostridiales bacterium]|nr:IS1634 family transposase [Clostridiales bacterium]
MYLKKSFNKNTGRTYLSIAKKYRNPKTGISTDRNIKSLGFLDVLEKEYDDPVAHFKEVALKMTEEEKLENKITLSINMDEKLTPDTDNGKNFGYAAILKVYHELELDRFLKNKSRHESFKYNTNSIMILLVISRILTPCSKKKAYENKDRYFERFNFSLMDVYRSLTHFSKVSLELQRHLHFQINEKYGRNTKIIYYDVTNYYFEIDKGDDFRKLGLSKEKRRDPIVQMGLAIDGDGIPLHYRLYPGNTVDKETFRPAIGEIRRNYDTGKIIVVADMGIITGDNIYYLLGNEKGKNQNGYIFSFSVRGGTQEFKEYVCSDSEYVDKDGKPAGKDVDFKVKHRVIARDINVTLQNGKIARKTVYEKQVIFWGKKYALKAKADREEVLKKAYDLVKDPKKYTKATSYGAAKYVKNLEFDKKTGEYSEVKGKPVLDKAKIIEDEKYDGYYAIVSSELDMSCDEIISTYRGLWEIEETFKITKSELETRPVYVSLEDHINAHFLTCFISLTILRIFQKKTNRVYSSERIIECLNKITCSNEQENIYLFKYRSEISDAIGKALGIDFTNKRLYLKDIKCILGDVKK